MKYYLFNGIFCFIYIIQMDSRAFVFSYFSKQRSWGFIALNNSTISGQIQLVPVEKWNDKYSICRLMYSQSKAHEMIETDKMMNGPDLYVVFDMSTQRPTPLITIWKPRYLEGIEFAYSNDLTVIERFFSFDEIKQKCIELLEITLTSCTNLPEGNSIKEFTIPF